MTRWQPWKLESSVVLVQM